MGTAKAERLLTVVEAAKVLRVCTATVRRLVKAGKMRHVRVGRLIRIPDTEVVATLIER